jgi:single-strand DNA-binding protein
MYHKIIVVGHLGKKPEMRYTPTGQAVTSFSVATSRKYTSNEQQVTETIWMRVAVWGKAAEACNNYLDKGALVLVEGRLTPDKASGGPKVFQKQDGTSSASYEMTAVEVKFLSGKGEGAVHQAEAPIAEDDVPF